MRFFTCVIDPLDRGVAGVQPSRSFEAFPRSRDFPFRWQMVDRMAVLTDLGEPLIASNANGVAVGVVRLDNRHEVERWLELEGSTVSDLELVLRTVLRKGSRCIPELLGDFGFLVWDTARRTLLAACDAFAVRKLYYRQQDGIYAFSSRAEALATDERYDEQYLAEFITNCIPTPGLTVYPGVQAVPGGSMLAVEGGRLTRGEYWSALNFELRPATNVDYDELAVTCRELLADALRTRIDGIGQTWAQLSGGLDSSSLVSMAQWMANAGRIPHGLAGTVTYVDREGTGSDEREFSNAVISRWQVRNELIVEPSQWYDRRFALPRTDQPHASFLFYPRERQLSQIVRGAGGSMLLTGIGGDELLTGTMFFFADRLVRGQILGTLQQMLHWAARGRVSFWELAYRNAFLPLLPVSIQRPLLRGEGDVPAWIPQSTIRRYDLHRKTFAVASYAGRIGQMYRHAIRSHLSALANNLECGVIEDALEVRHPFLYRPFVEFALELPVEACARPYARKWILREAMRDILPERVRSRVGKGSPASLYAETLTTQRPLLEPLTRGSILEELGVVDGPRLKTAFDTLPQEPHRRDEKHASLQATLMAEAWLQIRSGRWPTQESI